MARKKTRFSKIKCIVYHAFQSNEQQQTESQKANQYDQMQNLNVLRITRFEMMVRCEMNNSFRDFWIGTCCEQAEKWLPESTLSINSAYMSILN